MEEVVVAGSVADFLMDGKPMTKVTTSLMAYCHHVIQMHVQQQQQLHLASPPMSCDDDVYVEAGDHNGKEIMELSVHTGNVMDAYTMVLCMMR